VRRLVLLSFIWGWSFLFIKVAVEGLTPTTVACTRVALGAAFLLAFLRAKGQALPRDPTVWRRLAVVGLVGSALPFTMLAWGEERITSALTSVLNASTPLFTAALAAVMLRDRLRAVQVGGLVVGLVGVGVAAGIGRGDLAGSSLAGSAASVLAGACYGFSFTWSKKHLMGMAPLVAAFGQLATAAVLLAPFAVATSVAEGVTMTPHRAGAVVLLGVVGSGIAYVLNFGILADVGATRASLVTYIIPVVAVTVGVLVLDEPFHLRILFGGLLIVAGILAVHRGRASRPERLDRSDRPDRSWRRQRPAPAPLIGAPRSP
jgi:drug/metabolite transporter (DMT)-like permease